jgi:hypothetical protein
MPRRGRPKQTEPEAFKLGHNHCPTCGTCFLAATIHRCPVPVDPRVYEVMYMDMNPEFTAAYMRSTRDIEEVLAG